MLDLYKNQYSREILKQHIYFFHLTDILRTQKLDTTFIVRYILNNKYQLTKEEEELTVDRVLFFQPHISKKNLLKEMENYCSDDDSVEDFESISKRN